MSTSLIRSIPFTRLTHVDPPKWPPFTHSLDPDALTTWTRTCLLGMFCVWVCGVATGPVCDSHKGLAWRRPAAVSRPSRALSFVAVVFFPLAKAVPGGISLAARLPSERPKLFGQCPCVAISIGSSDRRPEFWGDGCVPVGGILTSPLSTLFTFSLTESG